jgi:hypothetical protein
MPFELKLFELTYEVSLVELIVASASFRVICSLLFVISKKHYCS